MSDDQAPRKQITPGMVINGWCSAHGDQTGNVKGHAVRRVVLPSLFLACLECHPELDPEREGEHGRPAAV